MKTWNVRESSIYFNNDISFSEMKFVLSQVSYETKGEKVFDIKKITTFGETSYCVKTLNLEDGLVRTYHVTDVKYYDLSIRDMYPVLEEEELGL